MILLRWLVTTIVVFLLPRFVAGITVTTIPTAVIVGACLVFLQMVIKPIVTLLTLPVTILTLGLFSLVVNGLFFLFVSHIVTGFSVANFSAAFIGALIVSIINWLVGHFISHDDK
ncbi:MAG TPA: phage holin family protein [Candidatus Paceibacterota bacterium]|jgi:putative membrane protein|nr:phage holin family protein [Candidatus Paceibacterota bacterium]